MQRGDGAVILPATVHTIGHSTRTFEVFAGLLAAHGIEAIADVRRFARSRRYPWFSGESLAAGLADIGIHYLWLPQLGGRRRARTDSPNTAWRNDAFRGYADHLASAEFADGFAQLLALALRQRTAIMCAEAVWWQCHRALISDVLKVRGVEVLHIADATAAAVHPYSSAATVIDGQLSYSAAQALLF